MPVQYYRKNSGLGSAAAYQIAAIPFLSASIYVPASGSTVTIQFPYVSKFVTIRNDIPAASGSQPLRFGMTINGVNGVQYNNYGILYNGEAYTGDWRISKITFMGAHAVSTTASVIAGLTGIDAGELPDNWSGSAGVG